MEEMEKEKEVECKTYKVSKNCGSSHGSCGGFLYFAGFVGAAIFFISGATSFGAGVIGFLKATVWPTFLVYEAFKFLIK